MRAEHFRRTVLQYVTKMLVELVGGFVERRLHKGVGGAIRRAIVGVRGQKVRRHRIKWRNGAPLAQHFGCLSATALMVEAPGQWSVSVRRAGVDCNRALKQLDAFILKRRVQVQHVAKLIERNAMVGIAVKDVAIHRCGVLITLLPEQKFTHCERERNIFRSI